MKVGDVRGRLPVKVGALLLSIVLAGAFLFCLTGLIYLSTGTDYDSYNSERSYFNTSVCYRVALDQANLIHDLWNNRESEAGDDSWLNGYESGSEMGFSIVRTQDAAVLYNHNIPVDVGYELSVRIGSMSTGSDLIVTIYLPETLHESGPFYYSYTLFRQVAGAEKPLLVGLGVTALAETALLIFLLCAAGHRRGADDILPNPLDRVPLDLLGVLCLLGAAVCIGDSGTLALWYDAPYNLLLLLFSGARMLLVYVFALTFLLSFATRFKLGKWWRNTLCWKGCALLLRLVRALFRDAGSLFLLLPVLWRTVLSFGVFALAQLILGYNAPDSLLLVLVLDLIVLILLCRSAHGHKLLFDAGARLAGGDADYRVDTHRLPRALRGHGEDLNAIGGSIAIAVERQLRSERMKTELITNVSHDIKTPLTSILNYVDLLQKEPGPAEQAEYLAVLERQARRLKRLTEDLVEASKAATGNLPVNPERTDLCELLRQAAGEYAEKLAASELIPVVTAPEEPVNALVDGWLLWRVLDNLLGNACKYALPGTRVYLDVRPLSGCAVLSVRNISRQQLNIDPDELTERFVRGDSARNTEGSGLGLNIARSLCELQGGDLSLAIDGDLFKATVSFPLLRGEEPTDEQTAV